MKILKFSLVASGVGLTLYAVVTVVFWKTPVVVIEGQPAENPMVAQAKSPFWEFQNPAADALINELKLEKETLAKLNELVTATTGTLAEMLTPTPEEPVQVKPLSEVTQTSSASPANLPIEPDSANARPAEALADTAAQTTPTQSPPEAELQSQISDESLASDALTIAVLPMTAGDVSPEPDNALENHCSSESGDENDNQKG